MPSYTLEIEAFGFYASDIPSLEIWEDGTLNSTHSIVSSGSTISVTINYTGSLPSSLSFTFNDGLSESGRTIEIATVKVNDRYINVGNFLSINSLTQSASATVDIANSGFIFDASEPNASEFTPVTTTLTTGNDSFRNFNGDDHVLNGLGGRDVIYLGAGNDKVTGGAGNDIIRGGDGNDLIFGDTGNDRIYGEGGDDTLYGGDNDDRIHGGAGNDEIHGGAGNDKLHGHNDDDIITGGDGNDNITGGNGNDALFGDAGADSLSGGAGNDTLDGGADNDLLYGGGGADIINGGDGNDVLSGDAGDDVLRGDDGTDSLFGCDGNDEMHGGADNDYLHGGAGNDTLNGDGGADILVGAAGADILNGGAGNDVLHGHGINSNTAYNLLKVNPDVVFNSVTNSFYQHVNTPLTYANALAAATGATLNGITGHLVNITNAIENTYIDDLIAGNGDIWLGGTDETTEGRWIWENGAEAEMNFWNGAVAGTAPGSAYQNWAAGEPNDYSTGEDYIQFRDSGTTWNDNGGPSNSTLTLDYIIEWDAGLMNDDNAVDTIDGGAGDDMIYGYGGNDVLFGGNDNDILFGGNGNDTLDGGSGTDALYGGSGNDTLDGGSGVDTLYGGTGSDTASFASSNSAITVSLITNIATGNGTDTLISIENILGSDNNDTIIGSNAAHTLNGGAGNDTIIGGEQTTMAVNASTLLTYAGSQDAGGTINFLDDDTGVALDGNLWKQLSIGYTVTANTIIEFDFRSSNEAEVSAIGFDNDNNLSAGFAFKVYGTQNWGINNFDNYDGSGDWVHYEIDIGSFYTGNFSRMFILNDDDGGGDDGDGSWRNITIHEGASGANTLTGGDGTDELYGDSGLDTFLFEDTNDMDVLHYFNTQDGDILDLSTILTSFTLGSDDISDFVSFTNSGDHVIMSVDVNGTTGGANFINIAELHGQADLSEVTLLADGNLVVS